MAEGNVVWREQFLHREMGDDPTAADRGVKVLGGISVLGFGVTSDLAVFGVLPVLDKELKLTMPGGERVTRDTFGIGDVRLFARHTVYKSDAPGRTFRIAPFLGVEAPTGDDNDRDRFGRLPAPLQLGSGSWDPFGGVVVTYQTLDYQIDVQASYKVNTSDNGFEFGDELNLDASLQYRLLPRELGAGVPGFLYGVLETNFLYQDKNRAAGVNDPNSGGTSFMLSPGLQYVTRKWIVEAIVQVPVAHDLNGTALEDDVTVRAGFRINF
ncbi:MAG: transporter [Sphingomonadales bacterium]